MASCGSYFTVCLSDNGDVYSFGKNSNGELGLGHCNTESFPKQILNIPKIGFVSCGFEFTMCIDMEGNLWSFGANSYGQLGIGNTTKQNTPQQIKNIPKVSYVSSGDNHTLFLTSEDSYLWSFGRNESGELCLGNKGNNELCPKKTQHSDVILISAGCGFSLFQISDKNQIFGCGRNDHFQLGLGHSKSPQIEACIIPSLPSNITNFSSGVYHNLYIDTVGSVFSAGGCNFGCPLGFGKVEPQKTPRKIPDIPKMKSISSGRYFSAMIDENGNVWTFGENGYSQLGQGDTNNRTTPTKIPELENIQQISGSHSYYHILARDYEGKIFCWGSNSEGQLGVGNGTSSCSKPKIMDEKYFSIWGNSMSKVFSWNYISEILKWNKSDSDSISRLQQRIKSTKEELQNQKESLYKQKYPHNSFSNWKQVNKYLSTKELDVISFLNQKQETKIQIDTQVIELETELNDIKKQTEILEKRKQEIESSLLPKAVKEQKTFDSNVKIIESGNESLMQMIEDVKIFGENENQNNIEILKLFQQKSLEEFDQKEVQKILWKMDLIEHQELFEELGLSIRDTSCLFYFI